MQERHTPKRYFNPRSPWGGDPPAWWPAGASLQFQFTLPVGGATSLIVSQFARRKISIHAPRGGSDGLAKVPIKKQEDFNPRSPWGERHDHRPYPHGHRDFNPRSPWGERRGSCNISKIELLISIHAPRGGSDSKRCWLCDVDCGLFQSTLPVGGATPPAGKQKVPMGDFNPRSPWGERLGVNSLIRIELAFQSTLPVVNRSPSRGQ